MLYCRSWERKDRKVEEEEEQQIFIIDMNAEFMTPLNSEGEGQNYEFSKTFKEYDYPQPAHLWIMINETTPIDINAHNQFT